LLLEQRDYIYEAEKMFIRYNAAVRSGPITFVGYKETKYSSDSDKL